MSDYADNELTEQENEVGNIMILISINVDS